MQPFCLFDGLGVDLFLGKREECVELHGAEVALFSVADGNNAGFNIFVAYNDHIRHLFQLCLTDLVADLFTSVVHLGAQTGSIELLFDLINIVEVSVGDCQQLDLRGSQPKRERAGIFFDQQRERNFSAIMGSI